MSKGMDSRVPASTVVEISPLRADGLAAALREAANKCIPGVTSATLQGWLESNAAVTVIDVRTREEWAEGFIPTAIHIDRGYLELQIERMVPDRSAQIVCYCAGGVRSLFSAYTLFNLGYKNVHNLVGGFDAWKSEGLGFEIPAVLDARRRKRYSRHLALPEVGETGQIKLLAAKVLCVGAGGLGSPGAMYLAAAGIGTLGIVDDDVVEESNLQRQLLHRANRVGQPKTKSAKKTIRSINADVEVIEYPFRLTADNVLDVIRNYHVVIDGSDNFTTRYIINDACVDLSKPFVHGSIFRFAGQIATFWPGRGPCYRCLYPQVPSAAFAPACSEAGVLGVLPGVIGMLAAVEVVKLVLEIGDSLVGRLLSYDALAARFNELHIRPDPDCPSCGRTKHS